MNQDQVKEALLGLEADVEEFSVIFSGKASRKVNGLYHPESREIILHNKNFSSANDLMYTAIHEFAHHLHFTRASVPVTSRAHTNEFWDLFHRLLATAETSGVYVNLFEMIADFRELTRKIKVEFLARNGALMKEFGSILAEAEILCRRHNARFDDYVDRVLGVHRMSARVLIRINQLDINPAIGFENMKTVASIKDGSSRRLAEDAFLSGESPDMVRASFKGLRVHDDPLKRLRQEKTRIERTIATLSDRLEEIEKRLSDLESSAVGVNATAPKIVDISYPTGRPG